MKMKKFFIGFLSIVFLVGLMACEKSEVNSDTGKVFPGTADPNMVVLDITTEPMEMNSMLAYDAISMDVLAQCMSGITKLDSNDNPVADLAEKWEISEDNKIYTIYLRKDAKWTNGESVTAKDFYFSWVTQLKPETGSYMVSFLYDNIKNGEAFYKGEVDESALGIKIIDDYTIQIEWERPMVEGLFLLSLPAYMPMNQKAYEEIGADEYGNDADKIVTNGAYKIVEWIHDDHIMLEKWDDYYNADNINIQKAKLVMISDPNTRLNAFVTGELDVSNLYSEQISQIKEKDENALKSYFDGGSWYLCFNTKNEFLENRNLRKALAYSVDVQSLLDNVINDGSVKADGLVPNTISGANGESYSKARGALFEYDINKAKEFMELALKELGVSVSDIKLTLDVPNTTYNQNQAAYIQQQWKENLGIDITINAQPWQAIQEAKWNGDFNISVEANGASENTAMSFLNIFISDSENDISGYSNSEYDKLINAAKQEGDATKKQELMINAEKLLIDDMVVAPLYYTCTTYAISDKLEGLVRTPFQFFNLCEGARIK